MSASIVRHPSIWLESLLWLQWVVRSWSHKQCKNLKTAGMWGCVTLQLGSLLERRYLPSGFNSHRKVILIFLWKTLMSKTWGWASNQQRDRLHRKFTWMCKKSAGTLYSLEIPSPLWNSVWKVTPSQELTQTNMSPALTWGPTQPVVELWLRKLCKVDRWLPVMLAAAFTCQNKRTWCPNNQSNGWVQINLLHLHSLPALCKKLVPS